MNRRSFLQTSATLAAASAAPPLAAAAARASTKSKPAPVDPERWKRNPKIQEGRQVALSLLKPTPVQLERALALHADALVFDAYGFSPRAAPTAIEEINRAIKAGASADEVAEALEASSMAGFVHDEVERAEYEDAWTAAGVTATWQQGGEEGQDPMVILRRLSCYTYVMDAMPEFIVRTTRPDDIAAAKKQGKHVMCLATNGVPLPQRWDSVEDELRCLSLFHRLGIRMMQLAYNRRNMICDGCSEPANAGLSDFGRAVVAEMNRVGIMVDLAHAGWQTALEAAKLSQRPVVASHTACAGLHRHVRCLPDDVLRAIADTGGYMGTICLPHFLGRTGDIRALLDHVDYAVKKIGIDHVAIGTDVVFSSRFREEQLKKIVARPRSRTAWGKLWPADHRAFVPANDTERLAHARPDLQMKSMQWPNWPMFTVGLVQRGYTDDQIRKLIGGNVLRVLASVVPWTPPGARA
jgi:membrane dipeptidase